MSLTWDLVKKPLKRILAAQFDNVSKNFRRAISETQNQVVASLQESSVLVFGNPNMVELEVFRRDDIVDGIHRYKRFLHVCALPTSEFSNSENLKDILATRLVENGVVLNALRNGQSYSDEEWRAIIRSYSDELITHFLPHILRQMAEDNEVLILEYKVLAFEKQEAIRDQANEAVFADLVILYKSTDFQNENIRSMRRARILWGRRNRRKYIYQRKD